MSRYLIFLLFFMIVGSQVCGQQIDPASAERIAKPIVSMEGFSGSQRKVLSKADSVAAQVMKAAMQYRGTPIFRSEIAKALTLKDSLYQAALGKAAYQQYKHTRFYASVKRKMALKQRELQVKDSLQINQATHE